MEPHEMKLPIKECIKKEQLEALEKLRKELEEKEKE